MKRTSSFRVWAWLGVSAALFAATCLASRRFPPAPPVSASAELRARLDSLRAFDAAALEKARQRRDLAAAAVSSASRAAEVQTQLAQTWEVTASPARSLGDVSLIRVSLRHSTFTEWSRLLAAVRSVQELPGFSLAAVSVSGRGRVLSVELTATLVVHAQPPTDNGSGLPGVVRSPQIR